MSNYNFNEENILFHKHQCLICDKRFSRLKDHLIRKHDNMTFDEYGIKFPSFAQAMIDANLLKNMRIGAKSKGRYVSEETRNKVSLASKAMHNRHKSENLDAYMETQRKNAERARLAKGDNYRHSEETKEKMRGERQHMKGVPKTPEHRKKISDAKKNHVGWNHKPETIKKIKESWDEFKKSDRFLEYKETMRAIGSRPENIERVRNMNHDREVNKSQKGENTSLEKEFATYLQQHNIEYTQQHGLEYKGMWSYDFYIPSMNMLVETDGEYWHSTKEQINKDKLKESLAVEYGYRFVRISDSSKDWEIIHKSDEIQKLNNISIINNRLSRL